MNPHTLPCHARRDGQVDRPPRQFRHVGREWRIGGPQTLDIFRCECSQLWNGWYISRGDYVWSRHAGTISRERYDRGWRLLIEGREIEPPAPRHWWQRRAKR